MNKTCYFRFPFTFEIKRSRDGCLPWIANIHYESLTVQADHLVGETPPFYISLCSKVDTTPDPAWKLKHGVVVVEFRSLTHETVCTPFRRLIVLRSLPINDAL